MIAHPAPFVAPVQNPSRLPARPPTAEGASRYFHTAVWLRLDAPGARAVAPAADRAGATPIVGAADAIFNPFPRKSPLAAPRNSRGAHQKHVPGPAPYSRPARVVHPGAVAEPVAVLVHPFRLPVVEVQPRHVERRERVQLARLREAVVVGVPPQPERPEDRVSRVNRAAGVGVGVGSHGPPLVQVMQ